MVSRWRETYGWTYVNILISFSFDYIRLLPSSCRPRSSWYSLSNESAEWQLVSLEATLPYSGPLGRKLWGNSKICQDGQRDFVSWQNSVQRLRRCLSIIIVVVSLDCPASHYFFRRQVYCIVGTYACIPVISILMRFFKMSWAVYIYTVY